MFCLKILAKQSEDKSPCDFESATLHSDMIFRMVRSKIPRRILEIHERSKSYEVVTRHVIGEGAAGISSATLDFVASPSSNSPSLTWSETGTLMDDDPEDWIIPIQPGQEGGKSRKRRSRKVSKKGGKKSSKRRSRKVSKEGKKSNKRRNRKVSKNGEKKSRKSPHRKVSKKEGSKSRKSRHLKKVSKKGGKKSKKRRSRKH